MSTEKENILPGEAIKSLDSINRMNQIGLQRSEHPRWFAISIALAIFLYFVTIPFQFPLGLVAIGLYLFKSQKLGIKPSYSWTSVVWVFVLAISNLGVTYLREVYSLIWAPYAGGLLATSIYYIRYEVGKRTRAAQRVKEEIL
jgi:energy-coupling factor transporter transmembrane protein EcfT